MDSGVEYVAKNHIRPIKRLEFKVVCCGDKDIFLPPGTTAHLLCGKCKTDEP